jgi:tRNA uridine 5-carbamoylmethylation protein Kti12
MTARLIITIGCPGAGKSTWAEKFLGDTTLRLERDRYREAIFGSRRRYHANDISKEARSTIITQAMLQTMIYWPYRDYAITDTGLFYHSVSPFIHHAQRVGAAISLVVFNTPADTLRARNITRQDDHRIPDDMLELMIAEFEKPDAWWRDASFHRFDAGRGGRWPVGL